jgi:hypothetical protein
MNEQLARQCYDAALIYVAANSADELRWVRTIEIGHFDGMTATGFLGEYCWVVYASGFRVSTVEQKFQQLKAGFCDFDLEQVCALDSVDAVLAAINNRKKAWGVVKGCRLIQKQGFEAFKAKLKACGMNALTVLPFIKAVTKKHLARNIGLLSVAKDDVLLVRLAKEYKAESVEELTGFLARETSEKEGVVDLVLWRFCADKAWERWRTEKSA